MKINTIAKEVNDEMKKLAPFRPWQYQDYKIVSVNYDVILSDIETYWNTQARMREGFSVDEENKTIYLPNFFTKVNGICHNNVDYEKFVLMLREAKNTIKVSDKNFFEHSNILHLVNNETSKYFINTRELMKNKMGDDSNFAELSVKNLLQNRIFAYEFEGSNSSFSNLTSSKQNQLVNFMKNVINKNVNEWNKEKMFNFINNCIQLPESIITLLNNFDYSFDVPKIIVTTSDLSENFVMSLYILNEMCIDIILLEPSGKSTIEKHMDINELSLGYFIDNFDLNSIKTKSEKQVEIQRKKKQDEINKKQKREDFFESLKDWCSDALDFFMESLLAPIYYILLILFDAGVLYGAVKSQNGWLFFGITVFIGLIMFFGAYFVTEVSDCDDDVIAVFVIVSIIWVFCCLIGKGMYSLCTNEEYNRSTHTHDGFEIIEEEEYVKNDFIIHYRPIATLRENSQKMWCYIENNADNSEPMYFKIKYKNSVIYNSAKVEPLSYVPYVSLDYYEFPVGTHELKIEFYKYDKDAETKYTDELLDKGTIKLTVLEKSKEVKEYLKENDLKYCNHS